MSGSNVTYFDNIGVEKIPKEMEKLIGNKNMATNICRIKSYDAVRSWIVLDLLILS